MIIFIVTLTTFIKLVVSATIPKVEISQGVEQVVEEATVVKKEMSNMYIVESLMEVKTSDWIPQSPFQVLELVECSWLNAKTINDWPLEMCSGLSAFCLNNFNVRDISFECLGMMSEGEWELLGSVTVRQILDFDPLKKRPDPRVLKGLLRREGGQDWPPLLRHYVIRNGDLARDVLDGASRSILSLFFNSPNLRSMEPKILLEFVDASLIRLLDNNAFSMLTPAHLQVFDAQMFQSITPEQFQRLPPVIFQEFTSKHALWMNSEQRKAVTTAQMFALGNEPMDIIQLNRLAQRSCHARLELWMMLDEEPCIEMLKYSHDFDTDVLRVLEERCATAISILRWLNDDVDELTTIAPSNQITESFHAMPMLMITFCFGLFIIFIFIVFIV